MTKIRTFPQGKYLVTPFGVALMRGLEPIGRLLSRMKVMTYETSFSKVPFVYEALPTRVVFGSGTRSALPAEVERLGIARALILHGQSHAAVHRELKQALGERYAGAFDGARMHTPVDVTETAMKRVAELNIDGIVAVSGGSTTGLAKAIA